MVPLSLFALTPVALQLKWKDQFQFAGYYAALEKGFYEAAGFDVTIRPMTPGMDVIDEVTSGRATYALGNSSLVARVANYGDVKLLAAIFQSSPLALISTDPEIRSIADFKGRRIAVDQVDAGSVALQAMLASQQISKEDLELIAPTFDVTRLLQGDVDVITAYVSNEPFQLRQLGVEYRLFEPRDFGFDFYEDILFTSTENYETDPAAVHRFKAATLRGWQYAFAHVDEMVALILKKYNSQNRTAAALTFEAETLMHYARYGTQSLGEIDVNRLRQILHVFSLMGFIHQNRYLGKFVLDDDAIPLTTGEKAFLQQKGAVTVCADPDQMPLGGIENGQLTGIVGDFIHRYERKIGIPIRLKPTATWNECIALIRTGRCDMAAAVAVEPNAHRAYLTPTKPYVRGHLAFATGIRQPYVEDPGKMPHEIFAVLKSGDNLRAYVRRLYPDIDLVEVATNREGMDKVVRGEVYGYIAPQMMIARTIHARYSDELKIMGRVGDAVLEGGLGISNLVPELLPIMNKAVASVDERESRVIMNAWMPVIRHSGIDRALVGKAAVGVAAVFALALLLLLKLRHTAHNLRRTKKELESVNTRLQVLNRSLEERVAEAVSELKEQKEAFESLYRQSADGVLLVQRGRFIDCNNAAMRMLGIDARTEVLGRPICEFAPLVQPDGRRSREMAEQMIDRCERNGVHRFEWMLQRHDGTTFMVEIVMTHLYFGGDETIHVVWRDIEERLAMERDAREREELMHHQAKNAQMGEMISMIAHQWRQPLNTLGVTLQTLELLDNRNKLTSEKLQGSVDAAMQLVQKMSQTITDFMGFLKTNTSRHTFAVESVIRDIRTIIGPQLEAKGITLNVAVEPDLKVHSYHNELAHVLINIIANAVEACEHGSDMQPSIDVTALPAADAVEITVQDYAGGIPGDIIDRIFELYFTTRKEGTGIGLYMSRRITEGLLRGSLSVKNANGGARFTIRLAPAS